MKRPQQSIIIKENNQETQVGIYKTVKEAEKVLREMSLDKLHKTGVQTSSHSNKVYNFEDGITFLMRSVREI